MKNNHTAIEFAKEFIENLELAKNNFDFTKDMNVVISKEILTADPNLKVLTNELKQIGFDLIPTEKPHSWILRKS